jgi:hypothetical protein
MRRLERLRDLSCDWQRFVERKPRALRPERVQLLRERLALDQLEDDGGLTVGFVEAVDRCDIGMVQRRE